MRITFAAMLLTLMFAVMMASPQKRSAFVRTECDQVSTCGCKINFMGFTQDTGPPCHYCFAYFNAVTTQVITAAIIAHQYLGHDAEQSAITINSQVRSNKQHYTLQKGVAAIARNAVIYVGTFVPNTHRALPVVANQGKEAAHFALENVVCSLGGSDTNSG
jgi:hypothetical protein